MLARQPASDPTSLPDRANLLNSARGSAMWYYIESSNKIVDLSPDWDQMAVGEGAPGPPRSEIIGCSLWDFVSGHETRSYLNALFFWCRQSNRAVSLPYRCDGRACCANAG